MRRLSLLRHAKSDWDDPSIDDFYRPLNGRGKKAAKAMGQYLLEQGVKFDLVVASPAARVVETLKGLGKSGVLRGWTRDRTRRLWRRAQPASTRVGCVS